jgi:O-antigen/teichoic acid export membrane protein
MSSVEKVARNAILLTGSRIVNPVLSMILVIAIARASGLAALGIYSLLFSFEVIFRTITSLGLNAILIREVARGSKDSASAYFTGAVLISAVAAIGASAVMMAIIATVPSYPHMMVQLGWLLCVSIVASALGDVNDAMLTGLERLGVVSGLAVAENVLRSALGAVIIVTTGSLMGLVALIVVLRIVAVLASTVFVHRSGVRLVRPRVDVVRVLIGHIPVMGGITVVSTVFWRTDVLMLSMLTTMAAVGLYSAAYRIFNIMLVIPRCFGLAVFPVISRAALDPGQLRFVTTKALKYLMLVIFPVVLVVWAGADVVIGLVYGSDYAVSSQVLGYLAWALVPCAGIRTFAYVLLAANRQRDDLKVNCVGAVVNIALNAVLIPRYGVFGAAVGTVVSLGIFLLLQCWFVKPYVDLSSIAREVSYLAGIFALVVFGYFALSRVGVHVLASAVVAVLAYGCLLFGRGVFRDLGEMRRAM